MKLFSIFVALCAAFAFAVAGATAAPAPSVVYDAIPSPLPPNMASLGFQATQTSQFGDLVQLAGTDRVLETVTVTMSDWALYADYATDSRYSGNSVTWSHPITVSIYSDHLGPNGVPDTLLATTTESIAIPWRPAEDPVNCPTKSAPGYAYKYQATPGPPDTNCYNGFAFNATFDLSSLSVTLPNSVIVGVALNTQSYGTTPIGVNGPYNSLNVGLEGAVAIGTDVDPDAVFWNTATAGWYTDGGAGGVGIFRQDTAWTPYALPVQITASAPLVGPPTTAGQCRKDGWKAFNNPSFKNQGDCVSFVATHGKNSGSGS
jgi:hypothetical protein